MQQLAESSSDDMVTAADAVRQPPRHALRGVDAIAVGLARIAAAPSQPDVYREAMALLGRLPEVTGVASLRHDDRGILVTDEWIGKPVTPELEEAIGGSLHQRWIAAHGAGERRPQNATTPFEITSALALVVPMVDEDALFGGFVLQGKHGVPAGSAAERLSVTAIGAVTAGALATLGLRQRLDLSISRSEHAAELANLRKTLSHEMHDGPTQDLALAGMAIDRLLRTLDADHPGRADADKARDLIDKAVAGMRAAIGRLRAPYRPAPSVTGPLRSLVDEMRPASPELAGLEVDFHEVSGLRLAPEVERAMVGIVREALHNVRKHAKADSVRLEVRRLDGEIEVAVADDGVGFTGGSPEGHFGLEQIRELAEGTGGRIQVGSEPGEGTVVRAWVPMRTVPATGELRGTSLLKPPPQPPKGRSPA